MSIASLLQLLGACVGILGSLFFAIGIIRQNAEAMARLSYTYWDSNPHLPAVLAAQRADYVFGGSLIVFAFALQLASAFFSAETSEVVSGRTANLLPWSALVGTVIAFFVLRGVAVRLARRYEAEIQEVMRKEFEEQERKEREEREARKNAT